MATITTKLPDDILERLSSLGSASDEIAEKMLKAGAEVAYDEVKHRLAESIGKDLKSPSRSTGKLQEALGVTPVKIDKDGNSNIKIGFAENRTDGKSNALVANILEFGSSKMEARPFMKKAKTKAKKKCEAAMAETFEEEVKKRVNNS